MFYELKRDFNDINYIFDYAPNCEAYDHIIGLKSGESEAVSFFARALAGYLPRLTAHLPSAAHLLVAPSSKVGKPSHVADCLTELADMRRRGEVTTSGRLIYLPDVIMRVKDIKTAHIEGLSPYNEVRASLGLNKHAVIDDCTYYIVIDDVTTTGRSLKLCRDLLVENGAMREKIILLALAKTIHHD